MSIVASIWLPLGLFSPFVLPGKLFLQQLTAEGFGWDDPIPPEKMETFEKWRKGLRAIKDYRIDRWLKFKPGMRMEVHTFYDASVPAYGGVSYAVVYTEVGPHHVTIINARSRVFPNNEKNSGLHGSMPRRELTAGMLGLELTRQVQDSLHKINFEVFLCSHVALCGDNKGTRAFQFCPIVPSLISVP